MAHGSKKWIKCYDGTIKRSNDRTKKDFYRGIKWWDETYFYKHNNSSHPPYYATYEKQQNVFCPQCKHVQKAVYDVLSEGHAENSRLRIEWDALYYEIEAAWDAYRRSGRSIEYWYTDSNGKQQQDWKHVYDLPEPTCQKPPSWFHWFHARQNVAYWQFHAQNYLCWKCERKYDMKQELWHNHIPGEKKSYGIRVKDCRKAYRTKVKHAMNRAKYIEELYDVIPTYKRDWLD